MPSNRFFISAEITRLTRDNIPELEDDWIEIKSKLNQKDQEDMQQHQIDVQLKASSRAEARRMQREGKSPVETSYRSATTFLLSLAIIDWSFIDKDTNSKIPITIENLHQLDPRLSTAIHEEIDERNPMSWETNGTNPVSLNTNSPLKENPLVSQPTQSGI